MNSLKEWFWLKFELNIELNHFRRLFNVWIDIIKMHWASPLEIWWNMKNKNFCMCILSWKYNMLLPWQAYSSYLIITNADTTSHNNQSLQSSSLRPMSKFAGAQIFQCQQQASCHQMHTPSKISSNILQQGPPNNQYKGKIPQKCVPGMDMWICCG